MFSIKKWFGFYFRNDWVKATGLVLLGFVGGSSPSIIQNLNSFGVYLNLVAGSLLLCYARILNDYFDAKIDREENHITPFTNKYKNVLILFLLHLPLIIACCIFYVTTPNLYASIAFGLFVFFATTYSIPKIRIRNKPVLGFLWNPFLALSIFAGSFLTYSKVNYEFLILAVGISLFYFFSEILHQLDHYKNDKQKGRKTIATKDGIESVLSHLKRSKYLTIPLFIVWVCLLIFKSQLLILYSIMFITNIWRIIRLNKDITDSSFKRLRTKIGGKMEIVLYIIYFTILPLLS